MYLSWLPSFRAESLFQQNQILIYLFIYLTLSNMKVLTYLTVWTAKPVPVSVDMSLYGGKEV